MTRPPPLVFRPVAADDLGPIVDLVDQSDYGLTSLPKDAQLLEEKVSEACRSFSRTVRRPGAETYLFVLEDGATGRVVGTSGVTARVGGYEPFYSYRIETHVYRSEILDTHKEVSCLHLVAEHSGPSEIGSLFLSPAYRKRGVGRLLSLGRFLYMAGAPDRFEREVIAEMRGVVDARGRCPFWEAIGRHFFDLEFPRADYLSMKDKRFIAELLPNHPIYVPLLPEEARTVLGQVHPLTRPALALLEGEGFRFRGMVDIFDGGPVVGCPLREIRTVRVSRIRTVGGVDEHTEVGDLSVVARANGGFRAALAPVVHRRNLVILSTALARALGVAMGDEVQIAPLSPRTSPRREDGDGHDWTKDRHHCDPSQR